MSDPRAKPNFLIIGAQRAGSTYLWEILRGHPDFFLPDRKELEFFSTNKAYHQDAFESYLLRFRPGADKRFLGEASPSYLIGPEADLARARSYINPNVPKYVRKWLGGDVRLLVTLRDPIDRAVSAYFHHYVAGRIRARDSILEVGKQYGIIGAGFYGKQLQRWMQAFDSENFFITSIERMAMDLAGELERLRIFFGDDLAPFGPPRTRINRGQRRIRLGGSIRLLRSPFGPRVTVSDLARLKEIYAEDQRLVRRLVGLELFD